MSTASVTILGVGIVCIVAAFAFAAPRPVDLPKPLPAIEQCQGDLYTARNYAGEAARISKECCEWERGARRAEAVAVIAHAWAVIAQACVDQVRGR